MNDVRADRGDGEPIEDAADLAGGESLEASARRLGHDLANYLTAIAGYAELLLMDLPPGSHERANAEAIRRSAGQAAELARELLSLGGEPLPAPPPEAAEPAGPPALLLVEDQDAVRHLARVVLERAGFQIVEAANGSEARDVAAAYGIHRIAAMVSDVVMPGRSGRQLAAELRNVRPRLPVLFLSGYAEEMIRDSGELGPGEAFLAKPFTPDALVGAVRGLLQTARLQVGDASADARRQDRR